MMPDQLNVSNRLHRCVVIAVAFAVLNVCGATYAQDRVTLRGSVRLDAGRLSVSLADVADLDGDVAQALGEAVVFEAAAQPTHPVTVSLGAIRRRLDESGANLGLLAFSGRDCTIRWRAEESPEVPPARMDATPAPVEAPTFASKFIGEQNVRGMVSAYLAGVMLQRDPTDVQLQFRPSDLEALQASTVGYELEIKPLASKLSSTIPLLIYFFDGAAIDRSFRVTVQVAVRQRVLVAQRYASRGEILSAGDVIEDVRIIEPQMSAPLQNLGDVLGMETRGRLVPGQILREVDVLSRIVVARNSEVTIRARHGMFVLRMRGRVLEDGRHGDLVRVQRISDRVELLGVVGADGEISVDTGYVGQQGESR